MLTSSQACRNLGGIPGTGRMDEADDREGICLECPYPEATIEVDQGKAQKRVKKGAQHG